MDTKRKNTIRKRKRKRRKSVRRRQVIRRLLVIGIGVCVLLLVCLGIRDFVYKRNISIINQMDIDDSARPQIDVQFLTPNEYSRPEIELEKIKGIVIHYTGNPGSTAQGNRNYFENLKDTHITKASSHYIVGLDGEIIQCIPVDEISYASNHRNRDTLSIEVCHPDERGVFNDATYNSLVHLTAWLCNQTGLDEKDVIRHYDVTEKICPKYYVEHEDAWIQFRNDVSQKMKELIKM